MLTNPTTGLQPDGSAIVKLYFDDIAPNGGKCLGGIANSWWQKDYSGDAMGSAYFQLPKDYDPCGQTLPQLLAGGVILIAD